MRLQTNGKELPNARVLNVRLFLNREKYHVDENNVLLMPFGQLLAHDISGLPVDSPTNELGKSIIQNNFFTRLAQNSSIFTWKFTLYDLGVVTDCCHDESAKKQYPQCQTVVGNPVDDPVYGKLNISCMGLFRSMTSRNYSCPLNPTTYVSAVRLNLNTSRLMLATSCHTFQINVNTHFIDASELYGSNEKNALRLRAMEGGKLNFTIGDNGQMFCPFLARKKNDPIEFRNNNFLYDTGILYTCANTTIDT